MFHTPSGGWGVGEEDTYGYEEGSSTFYEHTPLSSRSVGLDEKNTDRQEWALRHTVAPFEGA